MPDIFPKTHQVQNHIHIRALDMPRGGMPGESGDEDRNAGALCGPTCPRYRGDAVGRKLPTDT